MTLSGLVDGFPEVWEVDDEVVYDEVVFYYSCIDFIDCFAGIYHSDNLPVSAFGVFWSDFVVDDPFDWAGDREHVLRFSGVDFHLNMISLKPNPSA